MNISLRSLLALLLFWFGLAAPGAAMVHTRWVCWLHADHVQAVCTLIGAPVASQAVRVAASHEGDASARSQRELVNDVRERPVSLRGQRIHVPLHNVPFDEASVGLLMRSVLCGARPDCGALYHADVGQAIAQSPELFADLTDPLLDGRPI